MGPFLAPRCVDIRCGTALPSLAGFDAVTGSEPVPASFCGAIFTGEQEALHGSSWCRRERLAKLDVARYLELGQPLLAPIYDLLGRERAAFVEDDYRLHLFN